MHQTWNSTALFRWFFSFIWNNPTRSLSKLNNLNTKKQHTWIGVLNRALLATIKNRLLGPNGSRAGKLKLYVGCMSCLMQISFLRFDFLQKRVGSLETGRWICCEKICNVNGVCLRVSLMIVAGSHLSLLGSRPSDVLQTFCRQTTRPPATR